MHKRVSHSNAQIHFYVGAVNFYCAAEFFMTPGGIMEFYVYCLSPCEVVLQKVAFRILI